MLLPLCLRWSVLSGWGTHRVPLSLVHGTTHFVRRYVYTCAAVFKPILLQKFNYSPDWAATNCWHTIQTTKMWKLDVPPLMKFNWLFSVPLILLLSVCGSVVESYWRRRQMAHSLRDLLDELAFLNIKLSTCLSVSGNLLFQLPETKWSLHISLRR